MEIREKIYQNTKALARLNHEKVADVEKAVGISSGYLSRTHKGLTIEKVFKIADHFGITIDELVNSDFQETCEKKFAVDELCESINLAIVHVMELFPKNQLDARNQTVIALASAKAAIAHQQDKIATAINMMHDMEHMLKGE